MGSRMPKPAIPLPPASAGGDGAPLRPRLQRRFASAVPFGFSQMTTALRAQYE